MARKGEKSLPAKAGRGRGVHEDWQKASVAGERTLWRGRWERRLQR